MSANRIFVNGDRSYRNLSGSKDLANAAIKPGMLIERLSTGKYRAHATSGAPAAFDIAAEDALQGKTVDDAYAQGDLVTHGVLAPGYDCQVLLKAGTNYTVGTKLMSNGDGTFVTRTSTNAILCEVDEACDLSDSDAVDTLARVRRW